MVRILGQGAGDDGPIFRRETADVRFGAEGLHQRVMCVLREEWRRAGEHLLEDDGQAVLVAVPADAAAQNLWGGVQRRGAAATVRRRPVLVADGVDEAEVGDLEMVAD